LSGILPLDLKTIYERIKDNVDVLCNFSKKREVGKARSEYISLLKKDLCMYYSYNNFLIEKLMDLFPLPEVGVFIHFSSLVTKPLWCASHVWTSCCCQYLIENMCWVKQFFTESIFPSFLLTAGWFPWGQWNPETGHYSDQHTENKKEGSCPGNSSGWERFLKFFMCFVVFHTSQLT